MARRLFERIAVLLKADAHGVVESLEERSLLLKQYLREAELALEQTGARLDAVREEAKRLGDLVAAADRDLAALDADAALALAGGKDDLARFAVRRLLARRKERAALGTRLAACSADAAALAERVDGQQGRLDGLRIRVRAELARERAAEADTPVCGGELHVADEEVELELMRRRSSQGGPA